MCDGEFGARRSMHAHIVVERVIFCGHLNTVGQEAEDGSDPQQNGEATKKLSAELDPFRRGGGRCECIQAVFGQHLRSSGTGKALRGNDF